MKAIIHDYIQPVASPNGQNAAESLQESLHSSWWKRFKSKFQWENLIVAGREVKGIVLTPTMGLTLILAFLGTVGTAYWSLDKSNRENHDLLIRLDERLKSDKEYTKEKEEALQKRLQNMDALDIAQGRDIQKVQAQKERN